MEEKQLTLPNGLSNASICASSFNASEVQNSETNPNELLFSVHSASVKHSFFQTASPRMFDQFLAASSNRTSCLMGKARDPCIAFFVTFAQPALRSTTSRLPFQSKASGFALSFVRHGSVC